MSLLISLLRLASLLFSRYTAYNMEYVKVSPRNTFSLYTANAWYRFYSARLRNSSVHALSTAVLLCALMGCNRNDDDNDHSDISIPDTPVAGVAGECGSVRMTQYISDDRRWCGFDRTSPLLPDFVQAGMTVAVAEPYNGSSYGGEAGEACGECWEINTTFASQMVMVHDLCPIEGNPICAGSYFHFDVSSEVAAAIDGGGWLGEAAVRRMPCPVTGNVFVYIASRNQWGYMQIAFFNHRFPIRTVEYRPADGIEWMPMSRCLARWCLEEDMDTFAQDGPGGVFRLTGANGEIIESNATLTYEITEGTDFDIGVQFAETTPPEDTCEFTPPPDVYVDEWGGIDGVRWMHNEWGNTELVEIGEGCADNSVSCIRLNNFADSGVHLTYRHVFPKDTFSTIIAQLRADTAGTVEIAPRSEDARCATPPTFEVTDQWTSVTVNIADSCPDTDWLHGLTISRSGGISTLYLDNIIFQ